MQRHRSPTISEAERMAITVTCQRFIDEFLKPRFLPAIRPTEFNYPIDILGKHDTALSSVTVPASPVTLVRSSIIPLPAWTGLAEIASISNGIGIPELGTASIAACPLPRHSTLFNRTGFYTPFERSRQPKSCPIAALGGRLR
jgi:hypothetical protein